jgi:hypothetical protein
MTFLKTEIQSSKIEDVEIGTGIYHRKKIDYRKFIKRSALDSDYDIFIDHDFILRENGKPIVVYLHIPEMPSIDILETIKRIHFVKSKRTEGLESTSTKIFGFMPRARLRKDYCSSTAMAYEDPDGHNTVCRFGSLLSQYYERYCPDMYQFHNKETNDKIKPEWIIKSSPFTSGIINKNNPLKYHFDSGNIKSVFSNMVCFKKDCEGGHLAIPELNIGLEIADKTVLFFDGQSIMHGVTPFKITSVKGYRYTMVYYTLSRMWHCDTLDEELSRIKNVKTEREITRYKRITGQLTPDEEKKLTPHALKRNRTPPSKFSK